MDFEHEGVVRNHVSSNKNDPWSQKHTIRHQIHLSIWNRTKSYKIVILAAILDFEDEGAIKLHAFVQKRQP